MIELLKCQKKAQAWHLWLAFFLARAHSFLLYHSNKAENEVSFERKKKVEDEKPFKDVAWTENDVRSCPVVLQYLSRSLVSVM